MIIERLAGDPPPCLSDGRKRWAELWYTLEGTPAGEWLKVTVDDQPEALRLLTTMCHRRRRYGGLEYRRDGLVMYVRRVEQ